jgi:uncharacterized protein
VIVRAGQRVSAWVAHVIAGWSMAERIAAIAIVVLGGAVVLAAGVTLAVDEIVSGVGDVVAGPPAPAPSLSAPVAASPTPAPAATGRPDSATWPATRLDPVRVWVAGDSLGTQLAAALVPMLRRTRVFEVSSESHTSTGLCRPDFYDWPEAVRTAMHTADPDVVVIMLGANDTQDVWEEGHWIAYGTPAWVRAYRGRVAEVIDQMLDHGVHRVYWVGLPIMAQSWRNEKVALINGIYKDEAARHAGRVRYVDAWSTFAAGGGYTSWGRMGDGVHFTSAGEQRLAEVVLGAIKREW